MSDLGGFSMHELFRAEAETHCEALSKGLLTLESSPADLSIITPLMRAAHSMKGAARIVGIDAAVTVAHHMEDVLVRIQKGQEATTRTRIDQLLEATDLLIKIAGVPEAELKEWSGQHAGEINAVTTALSAPPGPSSVPPAPAPAVPSSQSVVKPGPVDAIRPVQVRPAPPGRATEAVIARPTSVVESEPREVKSVRVNADNLDRMMQLAGESMVEGRRSPVLRRSLAAVRSELARAREQLESALRRQDSLRANEAVQRVSLAERVLTDRIADLDTYFRRTEEVSTELYHQVVGSRMRPFVEGVSGFPRMIRDMARQLGKQVHFEIQGQDVPVDRDILARLEAPLNHLVRNALDHGLEMPDVRKSKGKPEQARLTVDVRHHAGHLQVRVSDDGRGIDVESIRRKVVERGMQTPELAAQLDERELYDFLFLPGFSTAQKVTEISGRGVGLDVVHQTIEHIGGHARVESSPGAGTVFTLMVPITLSVMRAALVEIAGEVYAFPLSRIDRVLRITPDELTPVQGRLQCNVDGHATGLLDSVALFGFGQSHPSETTSVIVLGDQGSRLGLVVCRFLGEQDLVVRTLDPRLGKVPHISSASILDDGQPVLIVDVEDLMQSLRKGLGDGSVRGLTSHQPAADAAQHTKRILVADDSLTVREVERQLLSRLGYSVAVAVDGMDAWNQLRAGAFDMLVTDIDMPRMNGIELVRLVRADPRFAHLPIAVVSYKDREEDRRAGLEAGANTYLTKGSFQDQSFIATITELVGAP
jgi:two-component system sensor histidine kinase and response regulator WspE